MLLSSAQHMTDAELNRAYAHASYDCQVVEFNVDHWIMTEQPDAARAPIENWLAALPLVNYLEAAGKNLGSRRAAALGVVHKFLHPLAMFLERFTVHLLVGAAEACQGRAHVFGAVLLLHAT